MERTFKKSLAKYSRTGCLQCKKSHLKCDETSPVCQRCITRCLQCTYFSNFVFQEVDSEENQTAEVGRFDENQIIKPTLSKTQFSTFIPMVNGKNTKNDTNGIRKQKKQKAQKITNNVEEIHISTFNTPQVYCHDSEIKVQSFHPRKPVILQSKIAASKDQLQEDKGLIIGANVNKDTAASMSNAPSFELGFISHDSDKIQPNDIHEISNNIIPNFPNRGKQYLEEDDPMTILTIEDLVKVMPTDLGFLNMIDIEYDNFYLYDDDYVPQSSAFEFSFNGTVCIDFLGIFKRHDPIEAMLNEKGEISLIDHDLLDFVWTMNKCTRYYFNFSMYPDEIYSEVLNIWYKLAEIYPIIQSVMTYDCSKLLTDIYKTANKTELFLLWDRHVRIPSFKQCLDILKDRIDTANKFSEYVSLTFAVIIIFSANSADEIWRTHLRGCYQLALKASRLLHTAQMNNEYDQAALKLFDFVTEWFFNTEFLSQVSSDNGCQVNDNEPLKYEIDKVSDNSFAILDNGLSMIGGYSIELKPLFRKIQNVLSDFKIRGINLSGNNLLRFKLSNKDDGLATELKFVGYELLSELRGSKFQYKRSQLHDYQMEFTLKNSDKLTRLALELYFTYFFTGSKSIEQLVELLEYILEVIYSIPYYSTSGIYCQWSIYLGAVVSLILNKEDLYQSFYDVLNSFCKNGMYVAQNSLRRLNHVKKVLTRKDYGNLVDPNLDFVLM